jgi:hypothetical protein
MAVRRADNYLLVLPKNFYINLCIFIAKSLCSTLLNSGLSDIGEYGFQIMNPWWIKAIFVGAALFAIIAMYRCAATLIKRRTRYIPPCKPIETEPLPTASTTAQRARWRAPATKPN